MSIATISRALAWVMVIVAVCFIPHLLSGPSATAARLGAAYSSAPASSSAVSKESRSAELSPEAKEAVQELMRQSWATNFSLAALGLVSSGAWLIRRKSPKLLSWVAVVGMLAFVGVFVIVVIPANSESFSDWLPDKIRSVRQLAAIGAWSFVLAEIHRVLAFLLSVLSVVSMVVVMVKVMDAPLARVPGARGTRNRTVRKRYVVRKGGSRRTFKRLDGARLSCEVCNGKKTRNC